MGCISLFFLIKKRAASKQKGGGKDKISENLSDDAMGGKLVYFDGPILFTADDLFSATAEIVGESPYDTLFKATFKDGREFSVKRLREETNQRSQRVRRGDQRFRRDLPRESPFTKSLLLPIT